MQIRSLYSNVSTNIQQRNGRNRRESHKVQFAKDTVEISIQARKIKYSNGLEALRSLTQIKGKQVETLQAHNNVLEFKTGSYYRFTFDGLTTILTGHDNGSVSEPYEEMLDELGVTRNFFGARDERESEKLQKLFKIEFFFGQLSENITGTMLYREFSNKEQKELLAAVGIKEGFFEVKSGLKSNKFYLQKDGAIIPNYQMEAQRRALNERNLFEIGYTKGETLNVEGKEYEIDDNGHVHIPEGVAVNRTVEKRYYERIRQSIIEREEKLIAQRIKINNTNLFDYGFSTGETLKDIGGIEYKIDETGHVNLPRGAVLMPSERLNKVFNS